jgi:L-ascorbate metabolism protein UlaG (beta-lactamase superfamily)
MLWWDTSVPRPFRHDDCVGYVVHTPDGSLLFPGDTRLLEVHLHLKNLKFIAIDVSECPYHMGKVGTIVLARTHNDALLFPYHYGTYDMPGNLAHGGNPDYILTQVRNPERFRVYKPGYPLQIK